MTNMVIRGLIISTLFLSLSNVGCEKQTSKEAAIPQELIAGLKSKDVTVRKNTAVILGAMGSKKALEPLLLTIKDENWQVRREVVKALGKLKDKRATTPLINVLNDDPMWIVQGNAACALGELGNGRVIRILIQALSNKQPFVRENAACSLGKLKSNRAIKPLIKLLCDEDSQVQQVATEALTQIGKPATKSLINALKDKNILVIWHASEVLGNIGDKTAVTYLLPLLKTKEKNLRLNIAAALGKLGNNEGIEVLINCLKDGNEEVKTFAALTLGKIGNKRATESLILLLNETNPNIKAQAVTALGNIKDPRAIEPLICKLNDEESSIQKLSSMSLIEIGEPAVKPLLLKLENGDEALKKVACGCLIKIGTSAISGLMETMNKNLDSDHKGTESIAWYAGIALGTLGKIDEQRILEILLRALKSENWYTRGGAVIGLGNMNAQQAVQPLINVLKNDSNETVRFATIESLAKIDGQGKNTIEALSFSADNDNNLKVRMFAKAVVEKLKVKSEK
ncbi:MAG: HEAT repeat domain-containing protein [bacterium]|nr:HEAT repeat domain-containing protein [bacterium]